MVGMRAPCRAASKLWKKVLDQDSKSKDLKKMVPEEGVEPTRPCDQRILSPPRLPFRHSGAS